MYSNTPVITSSGGCFTEAGGPKTIYTRAGDVLQLAEAMETLTTDTKLQETLKTEGQKYVQRFNGSNTSAELAALYRELA